MRTIIAITLSLICTAQAASASRLTPKNIDKVVSEMTLEEKANILVGYTFGHSYWGLPTNPDPDAGAIVLGAAGNTAKNDRLGIPHTVLADGPAGVHIAGTRPGDSRSYFSTAFPIGTLIASTWSTDVAQAIGEAIGEEARDYGVNVILGPGLNLMRNPLCGRNFEYFSEDPVLSGRIAAGYVKGVESKGVGTSPKHFAANSQESNRGNNDAIISPRPLRELYLKGFEIMVKEAQPSTIMSSYNRINGEYTQESHDLLTKILRDEWGFKGYVMTDWTNTRNTVAQVHAGNDLLAPGNAEQIQQIIDGVKNGSISIKDVDRNVKNILRIVAKSNRFKGIPYSDEPDIEAHGALVRSAAPEGMVLLKNDGSLLPLAKGQKVALFGATSYNIYTGGSGSGDVNRRYTVGLPEGLRNAGFELDTVLENVYDLYTAFAKAQAESEMGPFTTNSYFPRPRVAEPTMDRFSYGHAADRCDVAIVTIGRKSGEGSDHMSEEYEILPDEIALLKGVSDAFHGKGKKVVALLNVGGSIAAAPVEEYADAILLTWQPGLEGGNSIGDVVSGAAYPSGKLPMTWAKKLADHPSTANFPDGFDWRDDMRIPRAEINATPNLGSTVYAEGINVGYRHFTTARQPVQYPFGYGLAYTTFEYSDPVVTRKGDTYTATVTVTNSGSRPGKEAVQLYVAAAPSPSYEKPEMELKAFGKTPELAPGESHTLSMTFTNYDLASFSEEASAFVTDPGTYEARFAASADDVRQRASFEAAHKTYPVHRALLKK